MMRRSALWFAVLAAVVSVAAALATVYLRGTRVVTVEPPLVVTQTRFVVDGTPHPGDPLVLLPDGKLGKRCNTTGRDLEATTLLALQPLDGQPAPAAQTFVGTIPAKPRCPERKAAPSLSVPVLALGRWRVVVISQLRYQDQSKIIQTVTLRSAEFTVIP